MHKCTYGYHRPGEEASRFPGRPTDGVAEPAPAALSRRTGPRIHRESDRATLVVPTVAHPTATGHGRCSCRSGSSVRPCRFAIGTGPAVFIWCSRRPPAPPARRPSFDTCRSAEREVPSESRRSFTKASQLLGDTYYEAPIGFRHATSDLPAFPVWLDSQGSSSAAHSDRGIGTHVDWAHEDDRRDVGQPVEGHQITTVRFQHCEAATARA